MLEGVPDHSHSWAVYLLTPGDSLQRDGEGAHGPVDLVQPPIRFLSVIAFPDSKVEGPSLRPVDAEVLRLGELVEALACAFAAQTALLHAPERC